MEFVEKDKDIMPDLHNSGEVAMPDMMDNPDDFWNQNDMEDTDYNIGINDSPLKKRLEMNMNGSEDQIKIKHVEVGINVKEIKKTNEKIDCGTEKGKLVVVKDCGSCVFKKVEDLYPDDYMIELYGDLHCCDSKCKDKKKTMRYLIQKGNGNCIWLCGNCEKKEDKHSCQKMFCNLCYFKYMEKLSGGSKIRRTSADGVMNKATLVYL